jgi:signal transduction histidine kinase
MNFSWRLASGDPAPPDRGPDPVEAALLRALYRQFVPILAGNLAVAAVIVAILWNDADPVKLGIWAAAIAVTSLGRVVLYLQYRRAKWSDADMARWGLYFVIGSAVSGALWGIGSIVLFIPDSITDQIFMAAVIVCMSAGALASSTAYLPAFFSFMLPSVVPIGVIHVVMGGPEHLEIGGLVLFFGAMVSWIARNFHVSLRTALSLQVERGGLLSELRTARDEAETASRAKSAFLANISHELRTPLNAINGFSQIMKDQMFGPLGNPRYVQYAGLIHESGRHLLQLIEDILDLSKIESGSVELQESTFGAAAAVEVSVGLLIERARRDGVQLYTRIAPDLPDLHADERRFRQIALNLVANAVKFTPEGGTVVVSAGRDEDGAFVLTVGDTGVGIAAEDMARIMAPFVQGGESGDRNLEGAGLGLPLVKLLVDLHGGELAIESTPGKGTTVTVRMPAARTVPTDRRRSA